MNKKENIICKNCGFIQEAKKLIITTIPLPAGGSHKKACCLGCKKFIKFLPHNVPGTLYFGKHKGKTVSEIALTDLPYLRWMDGMGIGSARLQGAVKEALSCRK